ncbi:MAG TPA: FecR domain-containing protein [Vicinamibacterales bacterium]|jgi:transmembrane sensor|nr:FecR domain-containing protein [Vicinamibacterales bacterium]
MTQDERTPETEAAEWVIALREEPDDRALRARFTAWLEADPHHAEAWAEMDETVRIIESAPPERRTYDLPAPVKRLDRRWRWGWTAAAAAFVVLVLIAGPMISLRLKADHFSGVGKVENVALADGSVVELGPESAIAVDYRSDARLVRLLSGQAMFEVAPDPARPFRVAAGHITATALGTGFDVRMIGERTSVAVRHGRVRVQDEGATPTLTRELGAGEWVRFAPDRPMEEGAGAAEIVGAWRSGTIPIRNRPIAEAIDEARPWFRGRIVLADRALGERLVTGTYDFRDPAHSLALIVAPYGGQIRRITPWLLVVTGP